MSEKKKYKLIKTKKNYSCGSKMSVAITWMPIAQLYTLCFNFNTRRHFILKKKRHFSQILLLIIH